MFNNLYLFTVILQQKMRETFDYIKIFSLLIKMFVEQAFLTYGMIFLHQALYMPQQYTAGTVVQAIDPKSLA